MLHPATGRESARPLRRRPPAGDRRLRDHARGLLYERQDRHAGGVRLSPAPSDRHQGRPAHDRAVHRQPARGGLNGDQRADVLAFANSWRREATGGIVIDLPSGTRNEVAAANAVHEVRSILVGRRRAAACRRRPPLPAGRSRQARDAQDQLSDDDSPRPGRAGCGRTISARPPIASTTRTWSTGTSAARRSAISPPWSRTRPTSFSRAARFRPIPVAAPPCSTSTIAAKPRGPSIPTRQEAKISDVGKE